MIRRSALLFAIIAFSLPLSAAAFTVGDRVQATANLNVRASPSTSGTLLGTVPLGSLGTITLGPTVKIYTWWQVKWDQGLSGWSVQNYLQKVPVQSASITTPKSQTASSQSSSNVNLLPFVDGHNDSNADRINLVFVGINFASVDEFKTAASEELGWNGTPTYGGTGFGPFAIEPLRSNKDKFNVWYDPNVIIAGTNYVTAVDEIILQITSEETAIANLGMPYDVPIFLNKMRSDMNTFITPHSEGYGIVMTNNSFSSLTKSVLSPKAVVVTLAGGLTEPSQLAHELGHGIFGLADEKTDSAYSQPGTAPRIHAPDCVATLADAQSLWGNLVGQIDPFYTEWNQTLHQNGQWNNLFPPEVSWWQTMDEGMKVGYYYGDCYGDPNGTAVLRPTDFSIMHQSQIAVFGPVNRKQVETVLGFFSGVTIPAVRINFFSVVTGAIGVDPVPQGTKAKVQFEATNAKQCDMLEANNPSGSYMDQFNAGQYTTYATNIGSGGGFGSEASYYYVIPTQPDTMLMLHCTGYDGSSTLGVVHIAMQPAPTNPTAKLTANGAKNITVSTGAPVTFRWSSTGATSAAGTYTAIPADTCRAGALAVPMTVATSTYKVNAVPLCATGHTYTFTYTVQSSIGQTATSSVKVRVATSTTALLDHDSQVAAVLSAIQAILLQILHELSPARVNE